MKIKEIMTSGDVVFCTPNETIEGVARLMKQHDVGSIPIVEERASKKLVGIITDRDITVNVVAMGKDVKKVICEQFMTRDPATCRPEDSIEKCAKLMQEKQVRRIPVVDDKGMLLGMVAQADLALEKVKPETVKETVAKVSEPEAGQEKKAA